MKIFGKPVASEPGAGRLVHALGPHLVRMTAAQTGGALGMFEAEIPPGEGPPMHLHEREDEFFRVLSGRFLFICDGVSTELGEGGCILLPRGLSHRFCNIGDTVGRLMTIVTPGGFEGFFPALEAAGPDHFAALQILAPRFGLTFAREDSGRTAA